MTPRLLGRWLLFALLLAGVFGMHVLTDDDAGNGHGALPTISTAGHRDMTEHATAAPTDQVGLTAPGQITGVADPRSAVAALRPGDPGSGGDQGAMGGCILFLVVGAAAMILALLRQRGTIRSTGLGGLAHAALTDLRRRGPPGRYRPRVALCVIRI